MSVIQDALKRKLDEQRTQVTTGERPKPKPAPQQAPPVAQQVIQNENRDAVRMFVETSRATKGRPFSSCWG